MALSHDAATEGGTFTTTTPFTFLHTPVAFPVGVVVLVSQADATERIVAPNVTYGGVALNSGTTLADAAGEHGRVYMFSHPVVTIPSGPQTVSIGHDGNSVVKHVVCVTITGAGTVRLQTSSLFGGLDVANPSINLTSPRLSLGYGVLFSGHDDVASITEAVTQTRMFSVDFGTKVAVYSRTLTPATGTILSWTAASEDTASTGAAMAEEPNVEHAALDSGFISRLSQRYRRRRQEF